MVDQGLHKQEGNVDNEKPMKRVKHAVKYILIISEGLCVPSKSYSAAHQLFKLLSPL
jgi:hypothetical protein